MSYKKNLFLFFFLISYSISAQYVIKGKLLGYDLLPMDKAAIQQLNNSFPYDEIVNTFSVNNDGSFFINYPNPGYYRLRFCGLFHKPSTFKEFGIYIDKKDTVELNVALQLYPINEKIDSVLFWTIKKPGDKYLNKKISSTMNFDSTFSVGIITDSNLIPYCVSGVSKDEEEYFLAGDNSDFYELSNRGEYYSVIKTENGKSVNLIFDLKKYKKLKSEICVEIVKAPENTKKFMIVNNDFNKRLDNYRKRNRSEKALGKMNAEYDYDWQKDLNELENKIRNEKDEFLKKAWQISRYQVVTFDSWYKPKENVSKDLAWMTLSEIEPDSPLWSYYVEGMWSAINEMSKIDKNFADKTIIRIGSKDLYKPYMKYLEYAIEHHPDKTIKENLLSYAFIFSKSKGFDNEFEKYWKMFIENYPNSIRKNAYEKQFSRDSKIKLGAQIPDFKFVSINNPDLIVSKKSMIGKKYLINFWAAWCGPCRGNIEALRNIKNMAGYGNFSIISISLCYEKEDIIEYQKINPMPWFNSHVDMKNDVDNILKTFDVITIPKDILVDENGIIIAINNLDEIMNLLRIK